MENALRSTSCFWIDDMEIGCYTSSKVLEDRRVVVSKEIPFPGSIVPTF